jgi:methylated-DNA-[protein]-cysteine S-methyltransferase
MNGTVYYTRCDSPLGHLVLTSDGEALTGLLLPVQKHGPSPSPEWVRNDGLQVLAAARTQLAEYFAGSRKEFDLPLRSAGTEFQQKVWAELCRIPFGQTISYGELARRVGNANASRAVGLANGRNPIAIVVPCHRVIGANGKLVGYGGGLANKEALLRLEAQVSGGGAQATLAME